MHEVEETEYGLRLTLDGYIEAEEMAEHCDQIRSAVDREPGSFCVVADLRGATAMPDSAAEELQETMAYCDRNGLERSAGVFESTTTAMQIQKMAEKVNHAGGNTVFIDASDVTEWEDAALDWARDGEKPAGTL